MDTSIATSVRRARPSDAAALTDLVNRAFAVERWFLDVERTSTDEIAALIASGGFLVLEYAGGIGAAVLVQGPGQRDDVPPSHAYFGMLSVQPELQGMGLGVRLVRVAEAVAEASGATSMSMRILSLREELSRWYKSLGYREVGTAPFSHRQLKRPCHFIEMARPLAPAGSCYAAHAAGAA
ncbi:MAG TPA: GNAT family N-acetyltransferase [Kofleriaceae bacterium]